jgi:sugar lactone lactonase YvrE
VKRTLSAIILLTALAGAVSAPEAFAQTAPARGVVQVIAPVPSPGTPALPLVVGNDIWEGTYTSATGSSAPSKVFEFSSAGALLKTFTVEGQNTAQTHGVQVATTDSHGDLVLLDDTSGRVLLMNPSSGAQTLYSIIPQIDYCGDTGANSECSQQSESQTPEPDYAAWGPDGSLYVTDYQQGVIWRIPPRGGTPSVWLSSTELDGNIYGTAGIWILPDHHTLLFDQASNLESTNVTMLQGKLFSVQIEPSGEPGPLTQLWTSSVGALPDGFAVTTSGDIYMAQIGPTANDVIELSAAGKQLATFGTPASGANGSSIPFDEPSGVSFMGGELVVANQAYLDDDTSHMALLGLGTGEQGAPVYVPSDAGPVVAISKPKPKAKKPKRPKKPKRTKSKSKGKSKAKGKAKGKGAKGKSRTSKGKPHSQR